MLAVTAVVRQVQDVRRGVGAYAADAEPVPGLVHLGGLERLQDALWPPHDLGGLTVAQLFDVEYLWWRPGAGAVYFGGGVARGLRHMGGGWTDGRTWW